jgi:trimeric autotransporter adhesin
MQPGTTFRTRYARVLTLVALCFLTLVLAQPARASIPFSHTEPPIVTSNAILQGAVTPNGQDTVAWFEWGFDEMYGNTTSPSSVGSTYQVQWITNSMPSIIAQQTYHFCCVASNAAGVTRGADQVFAVGKRIWAWGHNQYFPNGGQPPLPYGISNAVALAADGSHAIALRSDGTVRAWGLDTGTGQLNVPQNLSNVVDISVGLNADFALKNDGTIVAWGNNSFITNIPAGLSNVVAIAAANRHVLALRRDGSISVFGTNDAGQLDVPAAATNIVAIAAAGANSLVLRDDGKVVSWGSYYYGTTNVPLSITNVIDVAATATLDLVLKSDGRPSAWGSDFYNLLIPPPKATNLQSVCAGTHCVLARTHDGRVIAWGDNSLSQTNVPVQLTNAVALANSDNQCLALGNNIAPIAFPRSELVALNDELVIRLEAFDANNDALTFHITTLPAYGTLYQYNAGTRGASINSVGTAIDDAAGRVIFVAGPDPLGRAYDNFEFVADDGIDVSAPAPVKIGGPPFVETQSAYSVTETSAVLTGMVTPNFPTTAWFEWGTNGSFQNQSAPQFLPGGSNVVWLTNAISGLRPYQKYSSRLVASNSAGVTIGADQIFGVARRGWSWTYSGYELPGLTNAVAIAPGYGSVLALKTDGTVAALITGQTAGTGSSTNVPQGLSNVVAISAGYNTSLALKSDGTLVAWGDLTVPDGLSNVVAIACGSPNLALQRDGTLVGWGNNIYLPPPVKNIVAMATPGIAVRSDGSLFAWGDNYYGQTNVPILTNVIAVGAGIGQRVAVTRDYNVIMWATNNGVRLSSAATNIVALASSDYFNVGLRRDGRVVAWGYASANETNVPPNINSAIAVAARGNTGFALTANRPPTVTSSSTASLPNGDVLVGLTGTDPDNDTVSFRVVTLPSIGTLYQFDGTGRGVAIVAANTPVTDSLGRLVYVPGGPSATSPYDAFQIAANDAIDDSSPAPVNISGTAFAHTLRAAAITETNALLSAMVTPNLLDAAAWFEWGADTNYGNKTPIGEAGFGSRVVFVTNVINTSGLDMIHFRVAVSNGSGIYYGTDQVFGYNRRAWAWGNGSSGQTAIPKGLSNCVALASGTSFSLALTTKGTVRGWGNTSYNETTPPSGLTNAISIAASSIHSAAVTSNRTVVAWGNGTFGETNVPTSLSNVVSVVCGSAHMLALRSDGSVVHWGYQLASLTNIPPSATNIVAIAAGSNVSIALRDDGRVVAWGDNVVTNLPANLSNVVAISARSSSCIALNRDGTITVWGTTISNAPPTLTNIAAISAGLQGMALDNAGVVKVWGNPTSSMLNIPSALTNSLAIAAGDVHAAALGNNVAPTVVSQTATGNANADLIIPLSFSDINNDICTLRITSLPSVGTLYQCVSNSRGAPITAVDTIITDLSNRVVFVPQIDGFGNGYDNFQLVANDSTADSAAGTISINVSANPLVYTAPATPFTNASAILNAMVVPRISTTVWFEWGSDTNYGQQTPPIALNSTTACVFVTNLISGLASPQSYHFRCVATNGGGVSYGADQIVSFGKRVSVLPNSIGFYPVVPLPPDLTNVIAVAAGGGNGLVLTSDRRAIPWGTSAETNFAAPLTNVIAIAAGPGSSMVLKADGSVVTAPPTSVPPKGPGFCSIAAGGSFYLAVRRDGTVAAWGQNIYGVTNVPAGLSNVVTIAGGYGRSTALLIDGTVVAWGGSYNGSSAPVTPPAGLSNVVAIASAGDSTMALKRDGTVVGWGVGFASGSTLSGIPPATAIGLGGSQYFLYTWFVANDGSLWQKSPYTSPPPYLKVAGYSNVVAISGGSANWSLALSDNVAPFTSARTYIFPPNTEMRLSLSTNSFEANGDPVTYKITRLPFHGILYQLNGAQRGQPITATNTIVSDIAGIVAYIPETNYFGFDTFAFSVNDGEFESAPGTITFDVRGWPATTTLNASSITSSNAVLNGTVVPFVGPTGMWFQFGTNTAYGQSNAVTIIPAGTNAVATSTLISGLSPLTTYHYRIAATNFNGTGLGNDVAFTTTVPPMQLLSGTSVAGDAFQLNFSGISNASYTVLFATNAEGPWTVAGSATQTTPGAFQFVDPFPTNSPARFYKVQFP